MKRRALIAMLVAACGVESAAHAAGPLGPDGARIRTSQYAVDPTAGVVLAGSRVTGLAGAYVAIAEGVDGNIQTPVAPAVRPAYSVDHFDYDLGLGILLPATLTSTDYFNTGRGTTQVGDTEQGGTIFVTPAVNLQWGDFGLGALVEIQDYGLTRSNALQPGENRDRLSASFVTGHIQAASMFFNRQLVLGLGLRASSLEVENASAPASEQLLFRTTGAGLEIGALWTPRGWPFRVGAAFRSGVTTEADPAASVQPNAEADRILGDPADVANAFYLPERVTQAWDFNAGIAISVGPRPLNPQWIDPRDRISRLRGEYSRRAAERRAQRREWAKTKSARLAAEAQIETGDALDELHQERLQEETRLELKSRYARLARSYVLISMSVIVTGAENDAVGVESFLQRTVGRAGESIAISPRLGIETELIPYWFKARIGSYLEPSRFASGTDRLHGTAGFDSKVFGWSVFGLFDEDTEWRIGAAADGARQYLAWGFSVGVWH